MFARKIWLSSRMTPSGVACRRIACSYWSSQALRTASFSIGRRRKCRRMQRLKILFSKLSRHLRLWLMVCSSIFIAGAHLLRTDAGSAPVSPAGAGLAPPAPGGCVLSFLVCCPGSLPLPRAKPAAADVGSALNSILSGLLAAQGQGKTFVLISPDLRLIGAAAASGPRAPSITLTNILHPDEISKFLRANPDVQVC
jgi:hypothetical protein